jgi:hypothetical protein
MLAAAGGVCGASDSTATTLPSAGCASGPPRGSAARSPAVQPISNTNDDHGPIRLFAAIVRISLRGAASRECGVNASTRPG